MPRKTNNRYYNRTNSCDICGTNLIARDKPRREIDKEGNWTGRWLCVKCFYRESRQISNAIDPLVDLRYKSCRIVDGKHRFVIVDKTGKIINSNPTIDELKCLHIEQYKDCRSKFKNYRANTEEELLAYLKQFYAENGRPPVQRDFLHNPCYPSFAVYQKRFGSWENALKLVELDVDTMVKKGILETENQRGRWFEIILVEMFENKPIDLSGFNCNSPYDGICPNGKIYEAKSSRLYLDYNRWCFAIRNKCKEDIQIFYFGAFNEDYTKLMHVWRVPGEIIESDQFCVGMYDGMGEFNVNNMKKYEITEEFNAIMKIYNL